MPLDLPDAFDRVISNGALAMPLFFMLSGFVLGYRYGNDPNLSFAIYYRDRIARIYPTYLVGLILCLPSLNQAGGLDVPTTLFVITIDLCLLQAWYPSLWRFWHHGGTWSLSVEMFLYACLPALLGLRKLSSRTLLVACAACLAFSSSWMPSLGIGPSESMPFQIYYSVPQYSLPVFAIGVMLSELHRRGNRSLATGAAPAALMLVLAFVGQFNVNYAGLNLITLPLIASSLLAAAEFDSAKSSIGRVFVNRASIAFGEISYPFFVYQIPFFLALDAYVESMRQYSPWTIGMVLLVVVTGLAAISHRWFEPWARRKILSVSTQKADDQSDRTK
jgi:peptidoglycan/LPS O-acetylase OafA/YrhL